MHKRAARTFTSSCRHAAQPATRVRPRQTHPDNSYPPRPAYSKQPRVLPKDQRDATRKGTKVVIHSAVQGDRGGWKYTSTRGSQERRLKRDVRSVEQSAQRPPSVEQQQFNANQGDLDDMDEQLGRVSFEPGTFVELRRNDLTHVAVILHEFLIDGRIMYATLSQYGEVWMSFSGDIVWSYPGFISPHVTARCGHEELAQNDIQRSARVSVLKAIRDFEKATEQLYLISGRLGAEIVYRQVRASSADEWTTVTATRAAEILRPMQPGGARGEVTPAHRFAAHKQLMNQSRNFIPDVSYQVSQIFHVRPQAHVDVMDAVAALAHAKGPVDTLKEFAEVASRVAEENRASRQKKFDGPPKTSKAPRQWLTPEFANIVQFLLNSLPTRRLIQKDPYESLLPRILQNFKEPYTNGEGLLSNPVVYRLLVDLGVIAPWMDATQFGKSDAMRAVQIEFPPTFAPIPAPKDESGPLPSLTHAPDGTPLRPDELYTSDPLAHLRHDFGDLAVYVIDSEDAEELDDGLSITRDAAGTTWMHVHIADPTSILPPTHHLARRAAELNSTEYLPHATRAMLPPEITDRCSLSSAVSGKPFPVLTFSFEVRPDGEIGKYEVLAGLVRNVRMITYNDVDAALGHPPRTEVGNAYPFGGAPKSKSNVVLSPEEVKEIQALRDATTAMVELRLRGPYFHWVTNKPELSIRPKNLPQLPAPPGETRSYNGFPAITYCTRREQSWGSEIIVAEAAKAASTVASRFCTMRALPGIRRCAGPAQLTSQEDAARILAARDAFGAVPVPVLKEVPHFLPSSYYSLEPEEHWTLGLPAGVGYMRVTSPLRRFVDMLHHWQIKHALLQGPKGAARALFSRPFLESYHPAMVLRDQEQRRTQRASELFWALVHIDRLMQRAATRGEGVPTVLRGLRGFVTETPRIDLRRAAQKRYKVEIPSLGVKAFVVSTKETIEEVGNIRRLGVEVVVDVLEVTLGSSPQLSCQHVAVVAPTSQSSL